MADDKDNKETDTTVTTTTDGGGTQDGGSSASSTEGSVDFQALAEINETIAQAEKERADAAEALIIKNKKLGKRHGDAGGEGQSASISEERVKELIAESQASATVDTTEEQKALDEAQQKIKTLTAKKDEIVRAAKARQTASTTAATAQRDGEPTAEPKLSEGSPLKDYKYVGQGVYSKKLPSGKTFFVNTKAIPGQRRTWTE